MKLYDVTDAPNPKVVRMFAAEKSVRLPLIQIDVMSGENRRAPFVTEINPTGQVPALSLETGQIICEVLPICEYLEDMNPAPALIGSTPEQRAETRMWTRRIDLKYVEKMSEACTVRPGPIRDHYATFTEFMLPIEVADMCIERANKQLLWLDGQLHGRAYVCGDRFTLADIHLWVFLEFFEKIRLPYPREAQWIDGFYKRIAQRPSTSA